MGPRVFNAREASALIPDIEKQFRDYDRIKDRIRHLKGKLDVLEMLWGEEIQAENNPDHREYAHYQEEVESAKKEFNAITSRMADMEVLCKSIEQGMVDFYGVIENRLVFLCWKRGEKAVQFYHPLDDGFQARKPIPAEELAK